MRCDQSHFLSAFLDGELSPAEALRVKDHLASCPACAAEADDLQAVGRLLAVARRSNLGVPSEDVMDRLRVHVRGLVETADVGLVWMARIFSGVAASVLVGGLWLLNQPAPASTANTQGVPWDVVAVSVTDPTPAATDMPPETTAAEPATRESVLAALSGVPDAAAPADALPGASPARAGREGDHP
jgi:anti-sigma factor RsiW